MAIEKCINEFDVDDVIFEEGSTGRELFVVLEGKIDIVKIDGACFKSPPAHPAVHSAPPRVGENTQPTAARQLRFP
jgi:hypothetical protein